MVQVTCEKTGITFEAVTKRTKNHPQIMNILNRANKDGWYGYAMRAIEDGRELGFASIEEFVSALECAETHSDEAYRKHMAEKRAEKEARRKRYIQNNWLSSHGYTWRKVGFADEEEADAFNPSFPIGTSWILTAPDGRTITVASATAEIEMK